MLGNTISYYTIYFHQIKNIVIDLTDSEIRVAVSNPFRDKYLSDESK